MPDIDAATLTPLELEYEYYIRNMDASNRPMAATVHGFLNLRLRTEMESGLRVPFRGDVQSEVETCVQMSEQLCSQVVDTIAMHEWTGTPTDAMRGFMSRLRHYYERFLRLTPNLLSEGERIVVRSSLQKVRQMIITGAPYVEIHNLSDPMVDFDRPTLNSTTMSAATGTPVAPLIDLTTPLNETELSSSYRPIPRPRSVPPAPQLTEPSLDVREQVFHNHTTNGPMVRNELNRQMTNQTSASVFDIGQAEPSPVLREQVFQNHTTNRPMVRNEPNRPMVNQTQASAFDISRAIHLLDRPVNGPTVDGRNQHYLEWLRQGGPHSRGPSRPQREAEHPTRNDPDNQRARGLEETMDSEPRHNRWPRSSTPVAPNRYRNTNDDGPGSNRNSNHVRFDVTESDDSDTPRRNLQRSRTPGRNNTSMYVREANRDNAHEQTALRKWCNNKYFDGSTTGMRVEQFITVLREYQNAQTVSDAVVVRNVASCLMGDAATWWRGRNKYIDTMEEFERQLRGRFAPQTQDTDDIVRAIHNRKQGENEYVQKYLDEILELMNRLPMNFLSEQQQLASVLRGLNAKMYPLFLTRPFHTIKELLDYALQLTRNQDVSKIPDEPRNQDRERRFRPRVRAINAVEMESEVSEVSASEEESFEDALVCLVKAAKQAVRRPRSSQKPVAAASSATATLTKSIETKSPEPASAQEKALADKLFNTKIGDLPIRCDNCLARGHKHYNCPFPSRVFCYGCGEPGVTVNQCKPCQNAKAQRLSKNEASCLESAEQTPIM